MKVALISCFGYYEQRIRYVKEAFERGGHDVHVIFSDFNHINKERIVNRVQDIEYIHAIPYKKNLSLARIYSHYRFAKAAYKRICSDDFDVIYAIVPPNMLCKLLARYRKKHNVKLIYDVYDLWPESFVYKRLETLAYPFFLYWRNLRNRSLNAADHVITECDLYHEVLYSFVEQQKLSTLYLSKPGIDKIAERHLYDELHICYLGSINNIINTTLICSFLKSLNKYKKVVLEIIGKGETKDEFIRKLQKAGIQYIDHGPLYGETKEKVMQSCHFGINMMVDAAKVGLTMKSIDYFENGLPILNNIKGDTWNLVEKHFIGFNTNEQTIETVAKEVGNLNDDEYQKLLQNTTMVFKENFSIESFNEKFCKIIESCENKKYNILVVSQYYYPEQFRINDVCEGLVKKGHHVTVLTGLPNYPEGIIPERYKRFKNRRETIAGVDVVRSYLVGRGHSAFKLFLNYLSFMLTACFKKHKLPKDQYDAVFVYEISPVTQIFPGLIYKNRFDCPLYVNCQDVWPEVIKVYNVKEESLLFRAVKQMSKWLYGKADSILVSSEGFKDYLNTVCEIPFERMKYLPNHAEEMYALFDNNTKRDSKIHLLFAGNIGIAQDLQTLIKAIALLSKEEQQKLIIDIVGDGSYLPTFKEKVAELNIESSFLFYGKKKLAELKPFYEAADAYVMTLEGGTYVSRTVPAKLQGYMAAGKPILAAIDGQAQEIIKEAKCGLFTNAGNANGYCEVIREFIINIEKYRKMGDNGRNYYMQHFTIDRYTDSLLNFIGKDE